ncbi:hypothetical protein SAMN05660831_00291 [Thiohalospira halophila DSM 15071]|uniref:Uncharacterized protein n=1 Tax=Thiohalospira halophila DSM 15071 TaxID=1123397 RepID=A0A1I1NI78_9GAMM|nr:hypothetical protein [Thiohalospira halophila]SFC97341.1 hypothetical protein SAMN05660831_00291 [Thiohalospira halophila DSM 15071]
MIILNEAQSRHLAGSFRAYGLGQLAAFGYSGIQAEAWWTVALSASFLLIFEMAALIALKDVENLQ